MKLMRPMSAFQMKILGHNNKKHDKDKISARKKKVKSMKTSKKSKKKFKSGFEIVKQSAQTNSHVKDNKLNGKPVKAIKSAKKELSINVAKKMNSHPTQEISRTSTVSKNYKMISDEQKKSANHPDLMANIMEDLTFKYLIHPFSPEKFFKEIWEQKPLLIRRSNEGFYQNLFTCEEFDSILKKEELFFTINLDVTSYKNGERKTLNPEGRALPPKVWSEFNKGHSIRLLNPQTFSRKVWQLNSSLQEYFNCGVGSNMYLTPAGSQGFAPHFDDIEAFVLQLEGQKRWKVYSCRSNNELLPRYSSGNFKQEDLGEPILDEVLNPGDLLYFPRGTIHQASTPNHTHSLHITISTYQKNSWADFMEKLIPRALEIAFEENPEFRRGLPREYLSYMGIVNMDLDDKRRSEFKKVVKSLMQSVIDVAPIDPTCDHVATDYIHNSLPPFLRKDEKSRCVFGCNKMKKKDVIQYDLKFKPETEIRLLRKHIIRLVAEEEIVIYHSADNSRVYQERPLQSFNIDDTYAPAIETLQQSYPSYIKISELPIDEYADQMEFTALLFEKGLILTKDSISPTSN